MYIYTCVQIPYDLKITSQKWFSYGAKNPQDIARKNTQICFSI